MYIGMVSILFRQPQYNTLNDLWTILSFKLMLYWKYTNDNRFQHTSWGRRM